MKEHRFAEAMVTGEADDPVEGELRPDELPAQHMAGVPRASAATSPSSRPTVTRS